MGENSKIEWTDHTFNPWRGCTKISAGCANCYAETMSHRNPGTLGIWGPHGTRVVASEAMWKEPLKWNAAAEKAGVRDKVFCASLADVFEDWGIEPISDHHGHTVIGPDGLQRIVLQGLRKRLFGLIDATPQLDWLLVTKRPENIRRMWPEQIPTFDLDDECLTYRPNVWLLTSVEDQAAADLRIPELLKCRDLAPVLGLSCEPLLVALDIRHYLIHKHIDWVIAGGESGPGARPMHTDWARSLRHQCQAAGVAFHFKQWGDWFPSNQRSYLSDVEAINKIDRLHTFGDPEPAHYRIGKKLAGRLLDGREWNEYPTPQGVLA